MVVSRDMTLKDFRTLLTPSGWLRGRIVSAAQGAVSRILGMRRTDRVRDWLYRSPLALVLKPRVLAWVVLGCLGAALLILLGLAARGLL
jgi:hypothetical protein